VGEHILLLVLVSRNC